MSRVPPAAAHRPHAEDGWRRTLLIAMPAAGLAFFAGLLLDGPSRQSTPFDRVAYPLLTLGVVVLEVLLWRFRRATGQVVTALVTAISAFFLSKLIYVLFFLPAGASVQAEMTESFFWIPSLYVLSLFVPNLRAARGISLAFFAGVLLSSVGYALDQRVTPRTTGVLFALVELNLANLTLLALTNVFIGYKDRLARSQSKAETLQRLAFTDLLTGLPNRLQLEHELQGAIERGEPFSLLFIDIDGFKLINDTLGHGAGDEVLRDFAERLQRYLKDGDLAARMSGDEFVLVLHGTGTERALALAHHVLDSVTQPYMARAQMVQLTASIGISACPEDAQDAETVLRHADAAMYHVKTTGKNGVRRFDHALDAQLERRKLLEREFQFALAGDQLSVVYQPIYDLGSGQLVKAETLLRWTHPEFGAVSPTTFIPIAESSGQIARVGTWVLRTACAQARTWRDLTGESLVLSVNVSPLQFAHQDFVQQVKDALMSSGLPASALELELTEGALIHHPDTVQLALRELQRMGVGIAIDDFGTGYSSLSYLRDLPINCIKIDRSFISDLSSPRRAPQYALALIEAIVGITQTLDLQVVAEGIETVAQLDTIKGLGCDLGQGFFFSKPLPVEDFTTLLRRTGRADAKTDYTALN